MGEMSRSQTLVLGREGGVGQGRAGQGRGEGRGGGGVKRPPNKCG